MADFRALTLFSTPCAEHSYLNLYNDYNVKYLTRRTDAQKVKGVSGKERRVPIKYLKYLWENSTVISSNP